jgi:hypothetical protein
MRRRLSVVTSLVPALLACAGCGLLPGGAAPATTPAASDDVRVWATDPGLTAARAEALRQALAGRPGPGCDAIQEDALERVEFPPPRLRASLAQGGIDRVWIERHRPTCPGPRVNLMAGFRPQPFATPLLPGETLADPLTQTDLRLQVRAAAEARGGRPRGCADEPTVLDTSLASPPATRAAVTTWRERWTVGLCGQRRPVDVAFTTREGGAGATTFQVVAPAPGGAPGRG